MTSPTFASNDLTLVSTFAGCGGSSCGYKAAGYDVRLAVEYNEVPAKIYAANFPATALHVGDIRELGDADALRLARVTPRELDVLDGSPPCQGFSTAGERQFDDPRNSLFRDYVRLLRAFQPRAFVMENVSGLRKGVMRIAFATITRELKASGYRVSCRELNAWWYGVPQDRRRLIWVGVREDLDATPSHPPPTVRRATTVAEALGASVANNPRVYSNPADAEPRDDKPARTMRAARQPYVIGGIQRGFGSEHREVSRAEAERRGFKPPSNPSPTLTSNRPPILIASSLSFPQNAARDGKALDVPVGTLAAIRPPHVIEGGVTRPVTVAEAKILQGFPDWFEIDTYWPIGNSVAPPMAEAIGRHVAALLPRS